nr:MAG TPA: hypothetical protein [Caudoviricetes sp.]
MPVRSKEKPASVCKGKNVPVRLWEAHSENHFGLRKW